MSKNPTISETQTQTRLRFGSTQPHPIALCPKISHLYQTALGVAYVSNSLTLMRRLPSSSIQAVVTSPPYALHFKKEYGNVDKSKYVDWFLPFAAEIKRILKPDGSFVLNI